MTIDTACENTVDRLDLSPGDRELPEGLLAPSSGDDGYCFGAGEPKLSTRRVSLPLGIGKACTVVKTSVIEEQEGDNTVPFLAGQDWLVLMGAVIDIGNNSMKLPALQCDIPLDVDVTGHMVIRIDEFPEDGWPEGLWARTDAYAGVIFSTSRNTKTVLSGSASVEREYKVPNLSPDVKPQNDFNTQNVGNPNFMYEPNDDSLTKGTLGTLSSSQRLLGVCECMSIRHHRRPRCGRRPLQPARAHRWARRSDVAAGAVDGCCRCRRCSS